MRTVKELARLAELDSEQHKQLMGEVKNFALHPGHLDRQECLAARTTERATAKAKMRSCVIEFLESGMAERFWGQNSRDPAAAGELKWPETKEPIIKIVSILMNHVISNHRTGLRQKRNSLLKKQRKAELKNSPVAGSSANLPAAMNPRSQPAATRSAFEATADLPAGTNLQHRALPANANSGPSVSASSRLIDDPHVSDASGDHFQSPAILSDPFLSAHHPELAATIAAEDEAYRKSFDENKSFLNSLWSRYPDLWDT